MEGGGGRRDAWLSGGSGGCAFEEPLDMKSTHRRKAEHFKSDPPQSIPATLLLP